MVACPPQRPGSDSSKTSQLTEIKSLTKVTLLDLATGSVRVHNDSWKSNISNAQCVELSLFKDHVATQVLTAQALFGP